jgi:hypothetical protein
MITILEIFISFFPLFDGLEFLFSHQLISSGWARKSRSSEKGRKEQGF